MKGKVRSVESRGRQKEVSSAPALQLEEWSDIYGRHIREMYAFLLRLTGCRHTAEDLVQESFVKAYERIASFRGMSSLKTWLFTIALNAFRDHARKSRRETAVSEDILGTAHNPQASPMEAGEKTESLERLRNALQALPDHLLKPLMLVRFGGMRYREAAEVLGISLDTVRMRVHRAHRALAEALHRGKKPK